MHRLDPSGKGEAAATDVERVESLSVGEGHLDHIGERERVVELEMGRIIEVDVAVPQRVEDQESPARIVLVDHHTGAEVGALDLAWPGQ